MSAKAELSELIRAMARRDWGTIDRLLGELRALEWDGAIQMIGAAFALAVHRRFQGQSDLREISRFVAETRSRYEEGGELPALETEGLIRAALGETDLMDNIGPDVALPAQIVVLGTLLQDEGLTEAELEAFIEEVEEVAAEYM
ncbi:hypothetical protein ACWDV4_10055 [Micromonospora sp. NPDC003197]